MKHRHKFGSEKWIIWHGKVVKFCNDVLCLQYIEKGDNEYSYNAQKEVPSELLKVLV